MSQSSTPAVAMPSTAASPPSVARACSYSVRTLRDVRCHARAHPHVSATLSVCRPARCSSISPRGKVPAFLGPSSRAMPPSRLMGEAELLPYACLGCSLCRPALAPGLAVSLCCVTVLLPAGSEGPSSFHCSYLGKSAIARNARYDLARRPLSLWRRSSLPLPARHGQDRADLLGVATAVGRLRSARLISRASQLSPWVGLPVVWITPRSRSWPAVP